MNKICIVKLRKKMEQALAPGQTFSSHVCEANRVNELSILVSEQAKIQEMHDKEGCSESKGSAAVETVTLALTKQQMNALRSNPQLTSLLTSEFIGGVKTIEHQGVPLVIKFQFSATIPLRLLKSSEVLQMLRISKSCLSKIVREGKLKSYKIGNRRRFLLDDILSYLHDNCELTDLLRNSMVKTPGSGLSDRSFQEV